MARFSDILQGLDQRYTPDQLDTVKEGFVFASRAHKGQVRVSGEPYLNHLVETAHILTQMKMDPESITAALLHDTLEDTPTTPEQIEQQFGRRIFNMVESLTKLNRIDFKSKEEKQAENFRKMILHIARDYRVLLIKLADRLHNMRTLDALPTERREKIAVETTDIYAPLAHRLGVDWIRRELEDLCFKALKPEPYKNISLKLKKLKDQHEALFSQVAETVSVKLREMSIEHEFQSRMKNVYSIQRKMDEEGLDFEQLYDILGFRIITQNVNQCYQALGLVHSLYTPIPGRFKDYLALPKANLYQSLHTSVIGPAGVRMEVQIRTKDMHWVAEEGIAAHWRYREGRYDLSKEDEAFSWLRRLIEWQKSIQDPNEFLDTLRVDLYADDIFVFTPKGDIRQFPKGATPLDFAYSVHSNLGSHCVGAKVNGRLVSLSHELNDGDSVEIITNAEQMPLKEWLDFVVTARARSHIRRWVKREERTKSEGLGKELLEKELLKRELTLDQVMNNGALTGLLAELKTGQIERLYQKIGFGKVSAGEVADRVVPNVEVKRDLTQKIISPIQTIFMRAMGRSPGVVKVEGKSDVLVHFGRCCDPLPGEAIVGYMVYGKGVSIHSASCANALKHDPERRVDVKWDVKERNAMPVKVKVFSSDRIGLLAKVSKVISKTKTNILSARIYTTQDSKAVQIFELMVSDSDQLHTVIRAIEKLPDVITVERVREAADNR
ncbi:MAG: bifunctional (p)ppGpp synthetase/guanosine-3',5'-bis(diphosphate) 3'-pyrophosphohydrolase [Nitrospirae bacterium]|nr:bifunctional (p)ppGpp synthetase/guanosine-3',5'-bis(diphosphate) 3'-pyrophosphohydrolase [Nitrospirota bacterium]